MALLATPALAGATPAQLTLAAAAPVAATREITLAGPPRPGPVREEHLLLTRYEGGVLARRVGACETFALIDGRTPALADAQEKLDFCARRHPAAAAGGSGGGGGGR